MRDESIGGGADSMSGMAEFVGDGSESVGAWRNPIVGGVHP